ncbi:MAG: radical SAM protein [Candidatus Binatia bacterium]
MPASRLAALLRHPRVSRLRDAVLPPAYPGVRVTPRRLVNLWIVRLQEALGHTRLIGKPIKLTVEATNICNLRCPACFTGAQLNGRPKTHMSLELYDRLLDELGDYLFTLEFFNWGEPLLAKHIVDMVERATARGISTTISTNFSFPFDAERAERLVRSGLQVLGVSIDGARQETYEQYRRKGDLATVLRNVALVRAARERLGATTPRLVWEYHVFPHNLDDVAAAQAMAAELGMDIAVSKGWTVGEEWDPSSPHRFFWYPTPPSRCRFLWQDAVVHNEGGVAPCCGTYFPNDDAGHCDGAGRGRRAALRREVWNDEKLRQARAMFRHRQAPDLPRDHVCYDCPVTVIWERWQVHQASGSTAPFDGGYGTNDCFNYFWNRRPPAAAAPAAAAAAR